MESKNSTKNCDPPLIDRSDSIQGTDYIANDYRPSLLNLRVSRTKIENLKQQIGRDINCVTFRKLFNIVGPKTQDIR